MEFKEARVDRDCKRKQVQEIQEKRKASAVAFTLEECKKLQKVWDENTPEGLQKKFFNIIAKELAWLGNEATVVFATSTIVLGVQNTNYSSDSKECVNKECLPTEPTGTKTTTLGPIVPETTIESESKISVSKGIEKMTSISAQTQTQSKRNNDNYKLPTHIVPYSYELYLCPDLETKKFTGEVTIDIDVIEPTDTIKLHSNGLNIELVEVDYCVTTTYYLDPDHELLIIKLHDPLPIGENVIIINFSGTMSGIVGLYYSTYEDENKEIRRMATTKFEPTYARQAFPCFDEPSMKAAFSVYLLKPKDHKYIALSNMPQMDTYDIDCGTMVRFKATVKMSTYLACFIICDFEYTKETILGKIPFRVYAAPNQITKTEYAKNVGKKVIEFYVNYFGIEYPLPKLDMVAIPDFVSGAMEHWGLVTFRETALLYSEEISSSANKQRVATVIAHELAHSWFGNLVTMAWWNDLWLNEGFASYIEYKGVDFAEPDWHMMDQFIVSDLHPVLVLDSTFGSHPIVQTVLTPDEITEIFDTISYNKGAAILRMLEDAVGADNFKAGVTAYLEAHKFGNAVTQDLWNELQTIVGDTLNVTEFMNTWTVQMGYPIITVKSTAGNYVLSQKRFLTDSSKESTVQSAYNYRWNIPVTYITSDNPKATTVWFTHSDEMVTIPIPSAKWVKFNYNQVGYYRVNYEESHWRTLIEHIGEMSVSDKVHLLEETFRIAESGELSYDIPLDLTKYLVNEIEDYNYLPWDVASTMLTNIKLYIQNSEYCERYKKYVIDLVSPAYEKLTWTENKGDSHIKRRARVVVLDLACAMGHEECLLKAGELFNEYLNGASVSQDLRTLVYKYGVQASSNEKWYLLWEKFVKEQYASEKQNLMTGLTYSTDATVLRKLIEFAKDESFIRNQDYFTCIQQVAANSIGTPIVWDYVRKNWDALVARFGLNERYLGRMIPSITKTFTTQSQLEEMQEFFGKYPHAGAGASARVQALETVQNNIKWLARYKEDIEKWIKNNTR